MSECSPRAVKSTRQSRAPRICFVGWGDHVHLERWATWFVNEGFDVVVISVSEHGRYPSAVRQFRLGLKGRGPRWVRLRLRFLLSRIRPDVVHVHWAHFAVPVRQVWRGPLVITAWGSDIYRSREFSADQWLALGDALRAADLITCDSCDLAARIRTEFDLSSGCIEVIQWGVNTHMFRPDGGNRRVELGLSGRKVVFSARNFTPIYNQETVVAAFAEVRRLQPDASLLMKDYGGDVDYLKRIRQDIDRRGLAGDVRIVSAVAYDEMPSLYRTADVMVSIPHSDAAPMALLEAMACGLPSVVCDLPSLREWVDDGITGYLVDSEQPRTVAAAIVRLLEDGDDRKRIGAQARLLVIKKASQAIHMAVMSKHYRRLADRGLD